MSEEEIKQYFKDICEQELPRKRTYEERLMSKIAHNEAELELKEKLEKKRKRDKDDYYYKDEDDVWY